MELYITPIEIFPADPKVWKPYLRNQKVVRKPRRGPSLLGQLLTSAKPGRGLSLWVRGLAWLTCNRDFIAQVRRYHQAMKGDC
jgi:hypothetical protein